MEEKSCRNCHYFQYGKCYCEDFKKISINSACNYLVSESGALSAVAIEFSEEFKNKLDRENPYAWYLNVNYPKYSKKRVRELSGKFLDEVKLILNEFGSSLVDKISDLYEEYEEGLLDSVKPPYMIDEGIEIDNYDDFYCKYWR